MQSSEIRIAITVLIVQLEIKVITLVKIIFIIVVIYNSQYTNRLNDRNHYLQNKKNENRLKKGNYNDKNKYQI